MRVVWHETGTKTYETGTDRGVLYLQNDKGEYPNGVAWQGLTGVSENPSGAEPNARYADNVKYVNLMSAEEFAATIEAFTYPDEFGVCDGSAEIVKGVMIGQQNRKAFGMSYRTKLGNDVDGDDYGYKIHLIYNALAAPSDKSYQTINDSPEAMILSWDVSTTPVPVTGFKPTASLIIDSTKVSDEGLKLIENILYGTEDEDARLPLPDELISLLTDTEAEG